MTPNQQQLATHQAGNREAATIVLADPAKFGGEESLMDMWARAWTNTNGETADEMDRPSRAQHDRTQVTKRERVD